MGFFDDRGRGNLGPPPEPFRVAGGGEVRPPLPLKWLGIAAGLLVVFIALSVAKSIYVDVLWFQSVNFAGVYRREIVAKIALFVAGSAMAAIVLGLNIWLARRLAPRGYEESFIEEIDPEGIRRIVSVLLIAGTLFFAVIFGSVLGGAWDTALSWLNGVQFGVADPQFHRDAAFYLFDLPAYQFAVGWVLALLVVSTLGAGAVYALTFSLQRFELNITRGMRVHLSLLFGLIFIVIAVSTWLSIYNLVASAGGLVYGATYADIHARLPVRYVLVALALFAGLGTIVNAFLSRDSYRIPLFALGIWAFVGIVGGLMLPAAVQSVQVAPNERQKEQPYIARNINATRYAWGLDKIDDTPYPANPRVTDAELAANPQTLDNVRLLDPRPLLDTFNQIQSIRPFYSFVDVDVDRYTLQGKLTEVMISGRELDASRAQSPNWTQTRLQLTHGFGAVVSPVSKVGQEGLPDLMTSDIPPRSDLLPISLDGSRIYYGELTNNYVIVHSDEPEFDYPSGEGNASTTYQPDRGIRLSSPLQRFALAWQLGDPNILISSRLTSDSRLLMHRRVTDRIAKVAPFLQLDSNPYLIIDGGRLKWIETAYTTATNFPYAQPLGGINYMRDSVKVVVDAITGDMDFYLMDGNDPVAATWSRIFPGLFKPESQMPESIKAHLEYPLDLFNAQAQQYLRYHITDPNVFFIGEDFWSVPQEQFGSQQQPVQPYYQMMRLPGENKTEFVLVMPFTPRNKQNTVAWLAARSDGTQYGTLKAFRFPTGDLVYGPAQIEARIDQNPGISQQMTLWNQSGSSVIRGNLLMIPIGGSFIFVEPIYLQAQNSKLPELARVVVANGNDIAMEPTLQAALDVVEGKRTSSLPGATPSSQAPSGGSPAATPTPTPATSATATATATAIPGVPGSLQDLLKQAQDAYDSTQRDLERLRQLLNQLQQLQAPPSATATATATPSQ